MAWLALVGAAMSAYGQYEAGQTKKKEAQRFAQAKEFEAEQLDQNALAEVAAGQRRAQEEQRRSNLIQSRALALAAAGGGASDPTVVDIISDLAGEGAYRSAVQMYEGEERARQARMGAAGARFEAFTGRESGEAAARAGKTAAVATIFSAAGSMYGKYGKTPGSQEPAGGYSYKPPSYKPPSYEPWSPGTRLKANSGTPGMYPYS